VINHRSKIWKNGGRHQAAGIRKWKKWKNGGRHQAAGDLTPDAGF